MYRNSLLANSVRWALLASAGAAAITAVPTYAADDNGKDAKNVERIEVTGSRIKRSDMQGASPVVVISADNIKQDGNFTVADALRSSTLNSFGSFSERSGSSAQSQATINLRGAGSSRTLVLLDGKRFPGSPTMGGASANLNAIPMAAVDRIEILTDGASSTYGSDAIAGVVNIILKKNFQGLVFNYGTGHRQLDKGQTSNEFSMLGGVSNDKGNITFSFDHQMRKGIADGQRDYTKAKMVDRNGDGIIQAYTETSGWSIYGATVATPTFSEAQASPRCSQLEAQYGSDVFQKVAADDDWGPGSTYCMYAYANVSYNTASLDRNTVYVNANYNITDDIQWYGRSMVTINKSFGRYAPPAAPWRNMSADNPDNPYGVDGAYGFFRWTGIGTRDNNVTDVNQDYLTGLRGTLDWHNANWEVYYHRNDADNKSVGEYYLSYGGLAYNEQNGIDLGSAEGLANMKATTLQNSKGIMDQYYAGIGFDMFELPGGVVSHYFGAERMELSYGDVYDAQSEAGLVGGSAGNTSRGTRNIDAFFYETVLPVTDSFELNLAARYDSYSDFGNEWSPKASFRWQLADGLVARGSYSEAFRAPSLDELYAATTFSAEYAIDFNNGGTTQQQFDTYYKSNPNLEAETSKYTNLGLAYDLNRNIGFTLDYFDLKIKNVIQTKSVQDLITDEANGKLTAVPQGTDVSNMKYYLIRGATGTLIQAGTGYYNGVGFNIKGLDFGINGNLDTRFGDFGLRMMNSFIFKYETDQGGILENTAGWNGQPKYKSTLTLLYTNGNHTVTWNGNYTAKTNDQDTLKYQEDTAGNPIPGTGYWTHKGKLDSWFIQNVTYTYDAGSYGQFSFTVNNLANKAPVLSSAGTWDNQDLYNNFGRDYRISYQLSF
ncbi:TonB-dependent receptor domain-containing protein [Gallaecimonas sp. GXIMD1310]|uniref:TonB-dependent receptor domain-containing protein n=1 Tax=Gallaecimonas sp. GXIMD1310 TaxID=3131926 RepID=UPI00324CAFAC